MRAAVDGRFPINDFPEFWGQFLVSAVAAGPEGVAANAGDAIVVQVRYSGGLGFVHEVGVPAGCASGTAERGRGEL